MYLLGNVIDALLVVFSAELYKDGIKVVIIPECFFTRIAQDPTMETLIPLDCHDADYIVAASYHSHHWSLILINIVNKRIYYLDPKSTYVPEDKIMFDLGIVHKIIWHNVLLKPIDLDVPTVIPGWTSLRHRAALYPSQDNGYDCGIFIVMFFFYLTRDAEFDFNATDCSKIRSWFCSLLGSEYTYTSVSPYIQWLLQHKMSSNKLGELIIRDIKFKSYVEECHHVIMWMEKNRDLFSKLPSPPVILSWCTEEQNNFLAELDKLTSKEHEVEAKKLAFNFDNEDDFRRFMGYVSDMSWSVYAEGPEDF